VESTGLVVVLGFFLLLLLLVIGAGLTLFDLAERREEDAEWLQMKIIDGLRRDPVLSNLEVLPVAHVPIAKRATVTIELSGEVPSEAARGAVLAIVRGTARKLRREVDIDDRLAISRRARVA